ncbi:C40 family peptidase [Streptomyces avicenniae]|uniref:C40 family peptidase n=1 Tax=Streptomyces avicenniae TaxID=500153 RepID=UPI00069BD582|nr:C40 family peptidase [Streptomyces avicenniae]
MSPIRHRGRHRKPRRPRTNTLLRGGVLSGIVGTVAVTGAASPATAAEQPKESTAELPVFSGVLTTSAATAAEATQTWAGDAELAATRADAQDRALADARRVAAQQRTEQEEAERQAAAERARAAADARAEEAARAEAAAQEAAAEPQQAEEPQESGGEVTTLAAPAASGSAAAVVAFAQSHVGDGYTMGGTGPGSWDCSGLVQAAYASVGVPLPRVSGAQSTAGTQVSLDALQPGDILYWGGAGSAYHVAIYVGGGQFVGAQNASTGVVQRDLSYDPPTGAVRVL